MSIQTPLLNMLSLNCLTCVRPTQGNRYVGLCVPHKPQGIDLCRPFKCVCGLCVWLSAAVVYNEGGVGVSLPTDWSKFSDAL